MQSPLFFKTQQVCKITGVSYAQIKYWDKSDFITPSYKSKSNRYYSFKNLIQVKVAMQLKENGLSLQKIRQGIANLAKLLPEGDTPLSKLIIKTDGHDMFVFDKNGVYGAITRQQLFELDTEPFYKFAQKEKKNIIDSLKEEVA